MNKLRYFTKTIPGISNLLIPIEDTIRNWLIPAIIGGRICNEDERKLLYKLDMEDIQFQFFMSKLRSNATTHE